MRASIVLLTVLALAGVSGGQVVFSKAALVATDISLPFHNIGDPNASIEVTHLKLRYRQVGGAWTGYATLSALAAADSTHAENYAFADANEVRVDVNDTAFDFDPHDIVEFQLMDGTGAGADTDRFGPVYVQLSPPVNAVLLDGETVPDGAALRTEVGLAAANLDEQFEALPTAAENAAAFLAETITGTARTVADALKYILSL